MPQRVEDQAFTEHRQHGHEKAGAEHGDPVVEPQIHHDVVTDVGAHHVESTVGKVGNVQNAVHQGQTQGHEAVDAAQSEAIKRLLKKRVQG